MLAAYGVDVLDPRTSTRRVHVLLERLPPAARRGGEAWSVEAELMAGVIDHLAMLTWVTLKANGAKGAAKPQPVKRPRRPVTRAFNSGGQAAAPIAAGRAPRDGKADSWLQAGLMLSAMPGVRVRSEDG